MLQGLLPLVVPPSGHFWQKRVFLVKASSDENNSAHLKVSIFQPSLVKEVAVMSGRYNIVCT